MSTILNASPQAIMLGTDDLSSRIVTPGPLEIPQHLPKFYFFARKGPTVPILTKPAELIPLYGSETVDINKQYYNHATRFMVGAMGAANSCITQRVVPTDAKKANVSIYLDIMQKPVPNYLRNSDGTYAIDSATGEPMVDTVTPTIDGAEIKFIAEVNTAVDYEFGALANKPGTMEYDDGADVTASTMYPWFEFQAAYEGEDYANVGITIQSILNADINSRIVTETKSLPYLISLFKRTGPTASPTVFKSLYGETAVQFSLKEKAVNPLTSARFDFEQVLNKSFYNTTDPLKPLRYSDFGAFKVYHTSIQTSLGILITNEATHISTVDQTWEDGLTANTASWFDFISEDEATIIADEKYLLNAFTAKSSYSVNYFTVIMSDSASTLTANQSEIRMSKSTPFYMGNGSDGTLTNEMFETVFLTEISKYTDKGSEVMDMAVNVESVIYDSGFTLDVKKEFAGIIGLRKDIAIVASTHDASLGEKALPLSDQRAIAAALKTAFQLSPESDYFGTGVMRGIIVAGTGLMPDEPTTDRIALTYSILLKSARMMGAGNGQWNATASFDRAPGSVITELTDIQPSFIPEDVKPVLWSTGIVWAQPFDRQQYFFPAIQTIYENDTSVLNSYFTMMAICTIEKIAYRIWQLFTGVSSLTNEQLADEVVARFNLEVKDRFAGRFTIIPEVRFTEQDEQRGFSWQLITKIGANNMKTVMVHAVQAYRMEDLA